ncbi:GNAT family N-acetyltransferase [Streptomyces hyaluromycini]|uniref:GNAT family N-acetyltransferase n=1 Tax=Streptomyces hyaluromycini TaxID=1377993 RepID=UPI003D9E5FEE
MNVPPGVRITAMGPEHAAEVLTIYQLGIDEGNATFETTAPTWEHFDATRLPDHRHVTLDDSGTVLGWVAAVGAGALLTCGDRPWVSVGVRGCPPRSAGVVTQLEIVSTGACGLG